MKQLIFAIILIISLSATATNYSATECQGSLRPYTPPTETYNYPDTLTPIFINHVGRHGSRFPASNATSILLQRHLQKADSLGTITPLGMHFYESVNKVITSSEGRWGELDSIGINEQRGIAHRMYNKYSSLLDNGNIKAFSTYSPRAVMSMYSFTHQLTQVAKDITITTSEGKKHSPILRFFDVDNDYLKFRTENKWKEVYDKYVIETCPINPIIRLLGNKYPTTPELLKELAINEYYLIAGMSAMGIDFNSSKYLNIDEYNRLWSIFNLRQYLQRTSTTISDIPATISAPLVEDIVLTADSVINGSLDIKAQLRFAHAETLMPLLSLLHAPNCFYMTHYFDTVSSHWKDFYVVPMAANLQLIYFTSPSGIIYVRADLNEIPIPIIPNNPEIYVRWDRLREYMLSISLM
ncbi:MAG: histidine-type phosphatase [Muribaculaceae bacterium]